MQHEHLSVDRIYCYRRETPHKLGVANSLDAVMHLNARCQPPDWTMGKRCLDKCASEDTGVAIRSKHRKCGNNKRCPQSSTFEYLNFWKGSERLTQKTTRLFFIQQWVLSNHGGMIEHRAGSDPEPKELTIHLRTINWKTISRQRRLLNTAWIPLMLVAFF